MSSAKSVRPDSWKLSGHFYLKKNQASIVLSFLISGSKSQIN